MHIHVPNSSHISSYGYHDAKHLGLQVSQSRYESSPYFWISHPVRLNQSSSFGPLALRLASDSSLSLDLVKNAQSASPQALVPGINLQSSDMRVLAILMVLNNPHLHEKSPQSFAIFSTTHIA